MDRCPKQGETSTWHGQSNQVKMDTPEAYSWQDYHYKQMLTNVAVALSYKKNIFIIRDEYCDKYWNINYRFCWPDFKETVILTFYHFEYKWNIHIETDLEIATNITHAFTHQITNSLLKIYPENITAHIHNHPHTDLFIATSLIIAKDWKQSKMK